MYVFIQSMFISHCVLGSEWPAITSESCFCCVVRSRNLGSGIVISLLVLSGPESDDWQMGGQWQRFYGWQSSYVLVYCGLRESINSISFPSQDQNQLREGSWRQAHGGPVSPPLLVQLLESRALSLIAKWLVIGSPVATGWTRQQGPMWTFKLGGKGNAMLGGSLR